MGDVVNCVVLFGDGVVVDFDVSGFWYYVFLYLGGFGLCDLIVGVDRL